MTREKGLVVDFDGHKVTVVTRDGRFHVFDSNEDVLVGEEVFIPTANPRKRVTWFLYRRLIPAAAIASLLLVVSFFGYTRYLEARPSVAYISLDLPESQGSVELEVNDKGLVKNAVTFDEASSKVISEIPYKMKPVEEVIQEFLTRENTPDSSVLIIGIIPVDENSQVDKLEKNLRDTVGTSDGADQGSPPGKGQAKKSFNVKFMKIDMETRAMAHELGISPVKAVICALAESMGTTGNQGNAQISGVSGEPGDGNPMQNSSPIQEKSSMTQQGESGQGSGKANGQAQGGKTDNKTENNQQGQGGKGKSGGNKPVSPGDNSPSSTDDTSKKGRTSPGQNQATSGSSAEGNNKTATSDDAWKQSTISEQQLETILKYAAGKDPKTLKDLTKNFVEQVKRSLNEEANKGGK